MTDHAHHAPDHAHDHGHGHGHDDQAFLHHDESSIFPAIVGTCVGMMLLGLAANWNDFAWGKGLSLMGFAFALVGCIGWWRELVTANRLDERTLVGFPEEVRRGLKIGFGFFIGSEVMFFAAFFAFYFYARFHAPQWPPAGYSMLPLPPAIINTALLVASGFFYMAGEHRIAHKQSKPMTMFWMILALTFGFVFLGIQVNEWQTLMHEGFKINDGTMGTAFYLLTGFHGFHVIIGALMITVVTVRIWLNHFDEHRHFAMTAAGWYWHFVDVVWIGLVLVLYGYDHILAHFFPQHVIHKVSLLATFLA
ncbi:MAG: cytochrome c oxidase subunit 3 [Cyanobacteria bacterium RYN_339]|nr:cytochrome c oxidase subunit 3 [Cyanobacteria bacterium RYN_339]